MKILQDLRDENMKNTKKVVPIRREVDTNLENSLLTGSLANSNGEDTDLKKQKEIDDCLDFET